MAQVEGDRQPLGRSDSSPALATTAEMPAAQVPQEAGPTTSRPAQFERSRSQPSLSFNQQPDQDGQFQVDDRSQELANEWTIWFDKSGRRAKSKAKGRNLYDDCIVELGSFNTVQGFWAYWESLHVHNLKDHCNLRVFKKGIKPLWEDQSNRDGGKWVVRGVPKDNRRHLWTQMVTALVKGRLDADQPQFVCGVVLSTRDVGDSMQLWVTDGSPQISQTAQTLRELLFPTVEAEYTHFIFQTHRELQPSAPVQQSAPPPPAAAVCDPLTPPQELVGSPEQGPVSPTAWQGQQLQADAQQPQQPPQMGGMGQVQQLGVQMPLIGQMLPGMMLPGQMPGMMPMVAVQGMGAQPMFLGGFPSPQMQPMGVPQQPQPAQRGSGGRHGPPAPDGYGDSDDDVSVEAGGVNDSYLTPEVRRIQERAKQIRTIRKRIRYVNFFLARQGKGRELTAPEQQRIKSLPFLQRELLLLEERQAREVEEQKQALGVESLDFLRKPQQPMTYSSEAERRFKTMRAIRKKIRFIHYHLERQRAGKILSAAEIAKVQALPEFERRLAELEAEEEADNAAAAEGQQDGAEDTAASPPAKVAASPHEVASSPAWPSADGGSQVSPGVSPLQQNAGLSITELQAQIELQRRELEEKQRHIERLLLHQGPAPTGHGHIHGAASPGPPPLGSPSMGPQHGALPLSPVHGAGQLRPPPRHDIPHAL
eukprot:TRINITY_DN942_c0_g2_i1.p1 TRINITY_DN942_c0_g2~~TRINITY_DN942_c0_g2_i1.p1  ORF type:complete len:705 (+),score=317.79 TRINITY_DN942_c0_g2_i1:335-2449(+)